MCKCMRSLGCEYHRPCDVRDAVLLNYAGVCAPPASAGNYLQHEKTLQQLAKPLRCVLLGGSDRSNSSSSSTSSRCLHGRYAGVREGRTENGRPCARVRQAQAP